MKISNIIITTIGDFQLAEIHCPDCQHRGWYKVKFQGKIAGDEEVKCHWCNATITFHWEK